MFDFDPRDLHEIPLPADYRANLQKVIACNQKITAAFSPEFLEELSQAQSALFRSERDFCYREGFQEGVLFMTRALLAGPDRTGHGAGAPK